MSVFTLKAGNTRPILEVALKNPDGTAHDLTGTTDWKLHVRLGVNRIFTRTMAVFGVETDGILRYPWVAADWNELPAPPRIYQPNEFEMEYEVIGGTSSMTFPNGGYDILQIISNVAVTESEGSASVTLSALTLVATAA